MRTYLASVAGCIVTFIGAAVVVLSCVEAWGVTLGGRHVGAGGYLGGALPPLSDALLDLCLGLTIGAAGLWLRSLARRRHKTSADAGEST
jgi:hypothetical protein